MSLNGRRYPENRAVEKHAEYSGLKEKHADESSLMEKQDNERNNLSESKVRQVHNARKVTLKNLSMAGLFIALSLLGANVKFWGNTIALDSAPGFLAALLLGSGYGGFVGAAGHLFSALISGMPLSPVVHMITAISMAVVMMLHGFLARKFGNGLGAIVIRVLVAILMNSVVATLPLIPILAWGMIVSLWVPLAIATTVNVLIAEFAYFFWRKNRNEI